MRPATVCLVSSSIWKGCTLVSSCWISVVITVVAMPLATSPAL